MENLKKIAEVLIKEEVDFAELKRTIENFKSLVYELSELDISDMDGNNDLFFDKGKALGTKWAALCLDDLLRTKKFIQGIYKAIQEKLNEKETVKILYAGTGPFATLILPLLPLFSSKQLNVILIEVNKETSLYLKKIISSLGFDNYVQEFIQADASTYKFNKNQQSDIVISETMQRALEKEQQVAVMMNILSQMKKDTIMIPQSIKLHAALITSFDNSQKEKQPYQIIDTVFDLNKKLITTYSKDFSNNNEYKFPLQTVTIDPNEIYHYKNFAILTEIQIFDNIILNYNESGLTIPFIHNDISELTKNQRIKTYYHVNNHPSLEVVFEN
ncbi:Predicted RNA methylase [Tenacibaculum sp. MAR_2009_124]|uniref:hypothetical protein n=1 Tax=Tenacibaculum sp. MAR_2009_124 TaxID=1250059 RepID=UPI000897176F|nr:hypothetical protein [Tenacibaculum sp. MAR_2009_124]SEB84213.1 Predicted RNA methylase [Tenacibaculum sp. MAR_2009_124]